MSSLLLSNGAAVGHSIGVAKDRLRSLRHKIDLVVSGCQSGKPAALDQLRDLQSLTADAAAALG